VEKRATRLPTPSNIPKARRAKGKGLKNLEKDRLKIDRK
jgi:hypothetical protein